MVLKFFTEEAYDRLYFSVDLNYENYLGDEEWLDDFFRDDEYYGVSQVEVRDFSLKSEGDDLTDTKKSDEDYENVIIVFNAMKNLTPIQASNKLMWSYLCHAEKNVRNYIQKRWLSSPRENTIRTRFFVKNANSLLNDNALSRLWWYGYLTYDENSGQPYRLTKTLLTNQTICTDLMDTMNRSNPNRIKGVLMAIEDFKEVLGSDTGLIDYFRECNKYLNHYGAVTMLDFLEPAEVRDLAFDYMFNLHKLNT